MAANEQTTLAMQSIEASGDDNNWRMRSEVWSRRTTKIASQRAKRERPRTPLILSGHGVSLRVEGGSLSIRNGLTHFPQKTETYRYFKGELAIPERIIVLGGSGSLSFDFYLGLLSRTSHLSTSIGAARLFASLLAHCMPLILIGCSGSGKQKLTISGEWNFLSR
jgi:hypothetical protein